MSLGISRGLRLQCTFSSLQFTSSSTRFKDLRELLTVESEPLTSPLRSLNPLRPRSIVVHMRLCHDKLFDLQIVHRVLIPGAPLLGVATVLFARKEQETDGRQTR